jgi:Ca2+-binding EF-hand superfamily protein
MPIRVRVTRHKSCQFLDRNFLVARGQIGNSYKKAVIVSVSQTGLEACVEWKGESVAMEEITSAQLPAPPEGPAGPPSPRKDVSQKALALSPFALPPKPLVGRDGSNTTMDLRKRVSHGSPRSVGSSPRLPKMQKWHSSSLLDSEGFASVRAAQQDEVEARRHLSTLRRRMQMAIHEESIELFRVRKAAEGMSVRTDIDKRVGRDTTEMLKKLKPATEEQLTQLAELFYARMKGGDSSNGGFFVLFKEVDEDGSGRISFAELERGCRTMLNLSYTALPTLKLQALWKALDADASGWVSAGEWGAFLKLGQDAEERRAKKAAQAEELRLQQDAEARFASRLARSGVTRASEEEVTELSRLLNTELMRQPSETRSWFKLFNAVDVDGSGLITYKEFAMAFRDVLRIQRSTLPDRKLQSVWLALMESARDAGVHCPRGKLNSGEFRRFIRRGESGGESVEAQPALLHPHSWRPIKGKTRLEPTQEEAAAMEERDHQKEKQRAALESERMRQEAAELERLLPAKQARIEEIRQQRLAQLAAAKTAAPSPAKRRPRPREKVADLATQQQYYLQKQASKQVLLPMDGSTDEPEEAILEAAREGLSKANEKVLKVVNVYGKKSRVVLAPEQGGV